MTLKELNHYFKLKERLNRAEDLLMSLQEAAHPGAQRVTGMPHASGIRDKVGDLAAEIADMQEQIDCLRKDLERERAAMEAFIDAIPDSQVRIIFRMRFLHGLTWGEVAAVVGGRNTEAGVKSICYRYLESCNAMLRDDA